MVAVFTSALDRVDRLIPLGLLSSYLMPAIKSKDPLPKNPNGEKALQSAVSLWQTTSPLDRKKTAAKVSY